MHRPPVPVANLLTDAPESRASAAPNRTDDPAGPRIPVAIVGAGYIAGYHLEVLRQLGSADIVGVCDPNAARLDALAREWRIPVTAPSVAELLDRCSPQVVHVLVPPPHHFDVATEALSAGLHVLVEKPLALRASECEALIDLARSKGVRLGVNHNAVFHPAFRRLLGDVNGRKLGRIEHVVSVNNLPLAQLQSGEHDHWMFREPTNILFEQATHPLSQICALLGAVRDVAVTRTGPQVLHTGTIFHSAWQMSLTCDRGTAQLFIAFGRSFPEATIHVVGQDGTARADLLNNTYVLDRATKYLEPVDRALRSMRVAGKIVSDGAEGFLHYVSSTLKLTKRSDPYYLSMLGSIEAFYDSLTEKSDPEAASGLDGLRVIAGLEKAADMLRPATAPERPSQPIVRKPARTNTRHDEILVLGGSGFIGRRVVAALARAGHPVRILSRRPAPPTMEWVEHLPAVWPGDIRDRDDIARAIDGCRSVIHLVSGAPASWAEYEHLFLDGTRNVAEACLRSGAEQLLFASSIAVYNLARPSETITEETPLDDNPCRAEYTRAKVACERLLLQMHRERGLPVTIFRPGVVVGKGGPVEHLGVGFWPTPRHCVSWGLATRAPLPFVLADDVADAFASAVNLPALEGQSFNLVGDVRLSAEEYIAVLREASGRDIVLHRQAILKWYGVDLAKWVVKAAARKPDNVVPSYRDVSSRALRSQFDCSRAKRLLNWHPVADRARFLEIGIWQATHEDRVP